MRITTNPPTRQILILAAAAALVACAGNQPNKGSRSPADPWEGLNRPIYSFNQGIDTVLFKPLAKGYEFIVPSFMRQGVTNFSRNLRTPLVAISNLLQGKGGAAMTDAGRFITNSTFGVFGLFDWATVSGLPMNNEDFGQTFAVWGVPDGPYVVLPLLGPFTLRDAFAVPFNFAADPLYYYDDSSVRDKIYGLRAIDVRQRLFEAEELIADSADRYVAIREAYLQRRRYLVLDGEVPSDDDFYDEVFEDDERR